jgi:hypothetical protein
MCCNQNYVCKGGIAFVDGNKIKEGYVSVMYLLCICYVSATWKGPADRGGRNTQTSGMGRNGKHLTLKLPSRWLQMWSISFERHSTVFRYVTLGCWAMHLDPLKIKTVFSFETSRTTERSRFFHCTSTCLVSGDNERCRNTKNTATKHKINAELKFLYKKKNI